MTQPSATPLHPVTRSRTYRHQVAVVLAAAFSLSLAYTVIVTVTGAHAGYSLGDPLLWLFYAFGFGLVGLVLRERLWAWWSVGAGVLLLIAAGVFYYPTRFPPSAQTPLGWLENDIYMGLLVVALYLCAQRLRRITLTPEG